MSTKYLDANNVIKKVYDPSTESLKTTAVASFAGGEVSVEISAADGDNIAISDGTNTVVVNPDGSLNVNVVTSTAPPDNIYNEVTAVPSNMGTLILSHTMLYDGVINQVAVSGTNIAMYEVLVDGDVIDKSYTYFGGGLNYKFDMNKGFVVSNGQNVEIRVTHLRPNLGDFNARLQIMET